MQKQQKQQTQTTQTTQPKKDNTIAKGAAIGAIAGTGLALLSPIGLVGGLAVGAASGAGIGAIVKKDKNNS